MLVKLSGSTLIGIDAINIGIEVNISAGTNYYIVGLADNTIKESLQRVESAIKQSGFKMPRIKIVINLFPADIRKTGSSFDLPIAIGILAASDQLTLKKSLQDFMIMGELGLDGTVRKIVGSLPIAIQAKKDKFRSIIIPKENENEASIISGIDVYGAQHLKDVVNLIEDNSGINPSVSFFKETQQFDDSDFDFSDVQGQTNIKRSLEIAAAGGHNVIMIGPPGAGKTMLAKRLPSILPPLSFDEAVETTQIYSVAGAIPKNGNLITYRPFRSPHHTISDVALVGGGSDPMPGEISFAHHGVLFLDELPEFKRTVLEVLRQPMEEKSILISRSKMSVNFPANFMLIASMNPCPCGYYNHPEKRCSCNPGIINRYLQKISGPLLDRIDLHVEVTPIPIHALTNKQQMESSANIRKRIIKARKVQTLRYADEKETKTNAGLSSKQIKKYCMLDSVSNQLLKNAFKQLQLSARAYDRIIKVSRTIADLAECEEIKAEHVAEGIQFRCLDREKWAS